MIAPAHSLTANYLRIGTIGLAECIQPRRRALRLAREARQARPTAAASAWPARRTCRGAGLPIYWNDMPHSGVQLKLDRSGGVTAFCGATEIGQGSRRRAGELRRRGARHRPVRHPRGHRRHRPHAGGSRLLLEPRHPDDGQRGDPGRRARPRPARPRRWRASSSVPKDRLVFAERRVFDSEDPGRGVSFAEAVCLAEAAFGTIGTIGSYTPPKSAAKFKGGGVGPSPTYSYTAAVVEVEVDPETGWIDVPRVWIAHDIGRSLNPVLVRGQVEGSVYMGLGEALMEEQAFRRLPPRLSHALVHKFPSMLEYKSPTSLDMPEIFTDLVEDPDPEGPVRRQGSRPGAAAADHAGGRQRGVRRGRRPRRRDPDHAREDPEGAARPRRAAGRRAYGPDRRSPRSPGPRRCGCRRRGRAATARPATSRRAKRTTRAGRRRIGGAVDDAPAALRLSRAAHRSPRRRRCSPRRPASRCWSPAAPTCCPT